MDVDAASVYLGRLLRVHLAGVYQDYLEGAGHVPHTCVYLLQGRMKEQCCKNIYSHMLLLNTQSLPVHRQSKKQGVEVAKDIQMSSQTHSWGSAGKTSHDASVS